MNSNSTHERRGPVLAILLMWTWIGVSGDHAARGELVISAQEAREHLGENATVLGTVVSAKFAPESKGKPTFLNFGEPHPNQIFTVVIYGTNRGKFHIPPEELYQGKAVRVTGKIRGYKGSPEIEVYSPSQVSILDKNSVDRGDGAHPSDDTKLEPGSAFTLLLNSPLEFDRPSSRTWSAMGAPLLKEIHQARSTIDFAIYGIRNQPEILAALEDAVNRGVVVRGVVDKDVDGKCYYEDTDELIDRLQKVKTDYAVDISTKDIAEDFDITPIWPRPAGFLGPAQCIGYSLPEDKAIISVQASEEELSFQGDIMHDKFFIIDERVVWTGSCNISDSCSGGYNANAGALVRSQVVAQWYTQEFEQMYVEGKFHRRKTQSQSKNVILSDGTRLAVSFSPQDYPMVNGLRPVLKEAKKSIDVAVFFLTHKLITADLIAAHQRGVKVRVILDATAATNGYTKHEILRAAGIPVKVENWGGKMHAKAVVVDNQTVVLGSMNWTSAGEQSNDENTLLVTNSKMAEQFADYFQRMWESIEDRWLLNTPDPESTESVNSLKDGVDNDFDGLIDGNDPGWGKNPPKLPPFRIVPKQDGYQLIKGARVNGKHQYFLPTDSGYRDATVERWFPSVWEARDAGWEHVKK